MKSLCIAVARNNGLLSKGFDMTDLINDNALEITISTRLGNFAVQPVRMGKFKAFARAAMPCANDVMAYLDTGGDLVALIDQHEEPLFTMVHICSGLTQEQYEQLLPDDYLKIVGAVIEINADFFVRNLLPAVVGRIQSIKDRVQNIMSKMGGMTQSNPSEPQATP